MEWHKILSFQKELDQFITIQAQQLTIRNGTIQIFIEHGRSEQGIPLSQNLFPRLVCQNVSIGG